MAILLYPAYLPNIWTMAAVIQANKLFFEKHGTYQKQTYRNRAFIYGPNGKQALSVPVHFTQLDRQPYSEVLISNKTNWQLNHWRSLESAYNTSAFFEFYKDRFRDFFSTEYKNIFELSIDSIKLILSCLDVQKDWKWSAAYEKNSEYTDLRFLVRSRQENLPQVQPYFQVFNEKHGFISNLSVIDLIFNEGPNALPYLLNLNMESLIRD